MDRNELYGRYPTVQKRTIDSILDYVEKGWKPGGFTTAVLENNLMESFACADGWNRDALFEIVKFVRWEIPGNCWGCPEIVEEHLESFMGDDE